MIDLILFLFALAMVYAGFRLGSKFGTLKRMWNAFVARLPKHDE